MTDKSQTRHKDTNMLLSTLFCSIYYKLMTKEKVILYL